MGWFILSGFAIALFGASVLAFFMLANRQERLWAGATAVVTVIAWVGITAVMMSHTVENGHIGIVKQFGSIVSTTGEGFQMIAPWKTLSQVSVRNEIRNYHMDDRGKGVGDVQSGSAVSKDSQPVFLDVQVNYSLVREGAVDLYRETGGQYVERILDPAAFQITKEVTAQFKAIEFAANREEIRRRIEKDLEAEVGAVRSAEGKELPAIRINNVSLKNVDFTDALSAAIEQTVEAEQQAKRETAKVQISEAQAKQSIAQANGEAQSAIERARGQATSNLIRARADAKANRLRAKSLTPLLIQQNAIEKLNPEVEIIVCPPKTTCVPNSTQVLGP